MAAKALESMGISLEVVRQKVAETIGPAASMTGSPPFTPRAKKVLELSLREALQLGHNYIGTEHMLLGLVREGEGVAAQVLVGLGADLSRVRQQVIQLLRGYKEKEGEATAGASPIGPMEPPLEQGFVSMMAPSGTPPDCPHCRSALGTSARLRRLDLVDEASGTEQAFVVVYCGSCGRSLAIRAVD